MMVSSTVMLWQTRCIELAYVARIIQGVGSAIVWVMSLAIMFDAVGHARIGEFMGYVGIGMNTGTIAGPKFGGYVYERWDLNGVFIMCLCLIAGDVVLRFLMAERKPSSRRSSITTTQDQDPNTPTSQSQEKPPSKRRRFSSKAHTLPPIITLLYRPRFLTTLWGVLVMAVIGDAFKIALPLQGAKLFGWTPLKVADCYIVLAAPAFLGPIFGRLADKLGPRWVAVGGLGALGACIVALRIVDKPGDKAMLWALLVLIGLGMTVALEPLTAEIAHVVDREDAARASSRGGRRTFAQGSYGQGYGLFNTAWSAGNTFGPLWTAYVYEKKGLGWNVLWLVLGVVTLCTAGPVFLMCGGWWFHRGRKV